MDKKVLLVGRNPNVLTSLASVLTEEGFAVKTTSLVEQASRDFKATDFDVIAFGRGVDAQTNAMLRAEFAGHNSAILFVDGLAPVIPLLVKQIKLELSDKAVNRHVVTGFSCERTDDTLRINVFTAIDCQLMVDLYQLDTIHTTQRKTLVSEYIEAGKHTFSIESLPDLTSTINFLVAEVADLDLAVLPL
ncbi:hypothetical protein GO730_26970 [Spirosoma sp. HMF3257]|uniref:Uncharacterized protein n=1 Tax=Spirosoma telluris TaxID=2183553 RepID=A0A327NR36_9BACT|nr:hypothetical protein [Spirosoma telluris]RAI76899.1 hypothetical protein HMF3257_26895 [Spirosoma telluris]